MQKLILKGSHYNDVIMDAMASQITSLAIVYSAIYSGANQRKHQSPASLAFVRGIHRWPVNSPLKGPVTRKMFPFDDVIMRSCPMHMSERLTWTVISVSSACQYVDCRPRGLPIDMSSITDCDKVSMSDGGKDWYDRVGRKHSNLFQFGVEVVEVDLRHICVSILDHHWFW